MTAVLGVLLAVMSPALGASPTPLLVVRSTDSAPTAVLAGQAAVWGVTHPTSLRLLARTAYGPARTIYLEHLRNRRNETTGLRIAASSSVVAFDRTRGAPDDPTLLGEEVAFMRPDGRGRVRLLDCEQGLRCACPSASLVDVWRSYIALGRQLRCHGVVGLQPGVTIWHYVSGRARLLATLPDIGKPGQISLAGHLIAYTVPRPAPADGEDIVVYDWLLRRVVRQITPPDRYAYSFDLQPDGKLALTWDVKNGLARFGWADRRGALHKLAGPLGRTSRVWISGDRVAFERVHAYPQRPRPRRFAVMTLRGSILRSVGVSGPVIDYNSRCVLDGYEGGPVYAVSLGVNRCP